MDDNCEINILLVNPQDDPNEGRVKINNNFQNVDCVLRSIVLSAATTGASVYDVISGYTPTNGQLNLERRGLSDIEIDVPKVSNRVLNGFEHSYTGTSNTDLHFSAGTYSINGILYNSPNTLLTLDQNTGFEGRIDAVVGTTASTLTVLTGQTNHNPVFPIIPEEYVLITYVSFPGVTSAGNSQITFVNDLSYTASTTEDILSMNVNGGFVYLPSNPFEGHQITVKDSLGTASSLPITIGVEGNTYLIDNSSQDVLNEDFSSCRYIFNGIGYMLL